MKKTSRSLFLAVIASAMLLPVFASRHQPIGEREAIQIRAGLGLADTTAANSPQTSAAVPTSTQATSAAAPTSTPTTAATSAAAATSHDQPSSSAPAATATHANSVQSSSTPQVAATSLVPTTATNSDGQIVTSFVITTPTMSSAPAPSHAGSSDDSGGGGGGGGLGTGSIVGLSVAGGIAAIGIILFFVWKFTRKRFTDFDDSEAIKWPELNAHNNDVHALPTNSTGRAGFGPENDSDINLTRPPSPGGAYANSIGTASVPEMYGAGDPYAVPPLPHLNPNQPYHDDPGAYSQPAGYYDPYRGSVPNTFADTVSDGHGPESIPMTRMRSPAPQVAYDMQGRGSPAPQAAMGFAGVEERSRTPNPSALGTGRASPSPYPGYGYGPR